MSWGSFSDESLFIAQGVNSCRFPKRCIGLALSVCTNDYYTFRCLENASQESLDLWMSAVFFKVLAELLGSSSTVNGNKAKVSKVGLFYSHRYMLVKETCHFVYVNF